MKKFDVFEKFLIDLFVGGQIEQLALESSELLEVIHNIKKMKLDFDDSYQYSVATKFNLIIVTYDKDFNHEGIMKKSPNEIVNLG